MHKSRTLSLLILLAVISDSRRESSADVEATIPVTFKSNLETQTVANLMPAPTTALEPTGCPSSVCVFKAAARIANAAS
jgi:hypothetical protein